VPALKVSSTLAARYSLRRVVLDHRDGTPRPIISFQTQKTPIVTAIAQSFVMEAFHHWAVGVFKAAQDYRVKHAIATILKVTMVDLAQASNLTLGDRCGAQGLFEVNQLAAMHVSVFEWGGYALLIRGA
jgi:acyl-CoA oxidase